MCATLFCCGHLLLKFRFGQLDQSEICTEVTFTPPEVMWTLIMKLPYIEVTFLVFQGIPEFLDYGRKSWTLDPRRWIPGPGLWTLDAKLWTLDAGLWMWNASCKTLKFKTVQSFENNGNAAISITSFLNSTLIKIPFVISGIKNYLRSAYFGLLYLTT